MTDERTIKLCEIVYDITLTLSALRLDYLTLSDDSREVFHVILAWAEEFEAEWQPFTGEVEHDYMLDVEEFTNRKFGELKETKTQYKCACGHPMAVHSRHGCQVITHKSDKEPYCVCEAEWRGRIDWNLVASLEGRR